jgi:hypothetical protein
MIEPVPTPVNLPAEGQVIRYDDVVAFLIAACPSYEGSPERASVDDANGEYIRVTGFVRHLIRLLDEGDTESFSSVFGVVEWILEEAQPPAAQLIGAGFFDDLADSSLYEGRRVQPVDFGQWLGPRARRNPTIQAILTESGR